jgi:hypothetical protein
MNERIKELVKQSGGEFWQRLENDVVNPEAYITFDPPESLEKFAELIVRECIGCCEQVISDTVPKSIDTFEQGGIHCMDEIKQHFGVEE